MTMRIGNAIIAIRSLHDSRRRLLEEHGLFSYIRSNKGYVLIIVLIISSLLITVANNFFMTAQTNTGYMIRFRDEGQAQEIAAAGIAMATFLLDLDKTGKGGLILKKANSNASVDSYNDIWALEFPPFPIENGQLTLVIRDEQSKINASIASNEFGTPTIHYRILERFFRNLGLTSEYAESILDWVDSDNNKLPNGAETFDYYSTLPNPYKAKNGPLDSIEELLMIKNFTPEIYYGLGGGNFGKERDIVDDNMFLMKANLDQPDNNDEKSIFEDKIGPEKSRSLADYIRAYGDKGVESDANRININTASYRVISALTDTMTPDKVTTLIKRRMTKPFSAASEVTDLIVDKEENRPILEKNLGVSSQIFSIKATGTINDTSVTIQAVYNRATKRFYYYGIR
jgi:type II secretory pathway component PulK